MFTDSERRIYRVCDGRLLDPLPLRRRLLVETKGQLNSLLDEVEGADVLAASLAAGRLAEAARLAFSFPELDAEGAGATESDCLDELYRFLGWLEGNA